jgi:TPR repeat protein
MYALGKLYRDGTAVPQDKAMARTWFERAQAAGHGAAAGALAKL